MLTEIVFILDESGSMKGLENDVIKGYNTLLNKQKKEKGSAYISTVTFSTYSNVIHNRVDIKNVKAMEMEEYNPRGLTALLDAIGNSIKYISKKQKESKVDKTLFVIMTDGEENASKKYSYNDIKKMISYYKEKYSWDFMFLGANIDAIKEGEKISIEDGMAVNFNCDSEGIEINYEVLNETITNYRRNKSKITKKWKENIEKDYINRSCKF
ncbi:VWA domain-containing protein [Streptobacillus felis]|uniref:VWA domain-containing protein n=1 Tax=Streptobacillus felis TaxID=1384509 RepID=A0A7Z0PEV7_9FUSO|nr:vWA domain-containing protein [Streptobacillus felis]NYV27941.1 VWA domain-containing protein [Streptobacillus felis]